MIACKTTIGFGAPTKAGKSSAHGSPLGADEIKGARAKLGWNHPPFDIPADILPAWRKAGERCKPAHADWNQRFAKLDAAKRAEFERRLKGDVPALAGAIAAVKQSLAATPKDIATRVACEFALESLIPALPEMVGGSADLTGSNNTRTKSMTALSAADYAGRFIHYGVREHGMAAAMNGMALHGGIIPYSGTFLVFSDYCRPAIRLAALMGKRVIHVMTHDSIGLGEDGPTHQPVEQLAALRAIPNLLRLPPLRRGGNRRVLAAGAGSEKPPERAGADAAEPAAACAEFPLPTNRCAAGAYEIAAAEGTAQGVAVRHRLGSSDRGRGEEALGRARHFGAGGIGALLRIAAGGAGSDPPRGDRRYASQDRRRSRRAPRLGRHHRLRRRFRRHDRFRRQRAL